MVGGGDEVWDVFFFFYNKNSFSLSPSLSLTLSPFARCGRQRGESSGRPSAWPRRPVVGPLPTLCFTACPKLDLFPLLDFRRRLLAPRLRPAFFSFFLGRGVTKTKPQQFVIKKGRGVFLVTGGATERSNYVSPPPLPRVKALRAALRQLFLLW